MKLAIDTIVFQSANAPMRSEPRLNRLFVKRIRLIRKILSGNVVILISKMLIQEYREKIKPRNELLKALLDGLTSNDGRSPLQIQHNSARWHGRLKQGS